MNINYNNSLTFGWNIKTHVFMTQKALENIEGLTNEEKEFIAAHSQDPDLMKVEVEDACARHFYDVLHEDPSFGTVNDDLNNAMSGFLNHNNTAMEASLNGDRKMFLTKVAHSVHYLQDGSTPPHTEHGNYLHKLYRVPMHCMFEKTKPFGASCRLNLLERGYVYEYLPFSSLKSLFHNTALFTVQPENHVSYINIRDWFKIQQRCINRGINASIAYFEYIMKYLPKIK